MDLFNIDTKKLLPYVIDSFTNIYGEEYRAIISDKVNKALVVQYIDARELYHYISFLKRCKMREYSINFLERIGFDVERDKKDNYTEDLDYEVEEILKNFISSSTTAFNSDINYVTSPLEAFNPFNTLSYNAKLRKQLILINYLRGENKEPITKENFDEFSKTNEYKRLLNIIEEIRYEYESLSLEYNMWEEKLAPYEEYIETESKRKERFLQRYKEILLTNIYSGLPDSVKSVIKNNSTEEQAEIIFGPPDISSSLAIEAFSKEKMDQLKSSKEPSYFKYWIMYPQSVYLENLGVKVPENILKNDTEEDVQRYLNFINQEDIKKYIPDVEVIHEITQIREQVYTECISHYYEEKDDFSDAMLNFNLDSKERVLDIVKNKQVCILGDGGRRNNNEFISVMFFTIRDGDGGAIFRSLMHEFGHVIDQTPNGCGFEPITDFSSETYNSNTYDNRFRKYEKFNETLNDIFANEALELLQSQGKYLIEPKEFTLYDVSNHNTALITKNILQPLIQKYRKIVIAAKINSDPEILINEIGRDNFEQLVDVVNKVDYLSRNGVIPKIENEKDNPMVLDYFKQIENAKQIYIKIDDYYSKNEKQVKENNNKHI